MERRRWLNQSQPQTLVFACFLLYLNAAFALLGVLFSLGGLDPLTTIVIAAGVGGGYGIANERKWGYMLALGAAFAPLVIPLMFGVNPLSAGPINLLFEILLVVLLLHTQSREYQRIWFK